MEALEKVNLCSRYDCDPFENRRAFFAFLENFKSPVIEIDLPYKQWFNYHSSYDAAGIIIAIVARFPIPADVN